MASLVCAAVVRGRHACGGRPVETTQTRIAIFACECADERRGEAREQPLLDIEAQDRSHLFCHSRTLCRGSKFGVLPPATGGHPAYAACGLSQGCHEPMAGLVTDLLCSHLYVKCAPRSWPAESFTTDHCSGAMVVDDKVGKREELTAYRNRRCLRHH